MVFWYWGESMYCQNINCRKAVPSDSVFCPYCGGREFSPQESTSSNVTDPNEISIENFQKIIDSTEAIKEKNVQSRNSKASLSSRFEVRMNSLGRKLPAKRNKGWQPGQAARKRNFFIAIVIGVIALAVVFQIKSNSNDTFKSATLKVLPGSEAYKIGYEAGRTFRSNISYNDEFINQWIPDARKMLDELGQSSENMTKDMIGQIADSAWTSEALEAGIMENSPKNRADFRRGMIDGYFN